MIYEYEIIGEEAENKNNKVYMLSVEKDFEAFKIEVLVEEDKTIWLKTTITRLIDDESYKEELVHINIYFSDYEKEALQNEFKNILQTH